MKKDIFETIKQEVGLTPQERTLMRDEVINSIKLNPVIKSNQSRLQWYSGTSPFLSLINKQYMPFVVALLLLLGGGTTSVFAQNSLPGQPLYGVKIHLNEKVESLLAITPEAQAQVDIKQASRRLEEADKLSSAGKLDSKTSDELKNNFAGSIESLSRSLEDLRGAGASTTVSRLRNGWKSEVDNHYDSFVAISSVSTSSSATTSPNTQILWNKDGEQNNERSGDDNKKVELRRGSSNNASEVRGRIIENEGSTGDNEGDDESDDREGSISKPITPVSTTTQTQVSVKNFTLTQVALHHTKGDCYSAVSGSVYDLTSWIAAHPGGQSAIVGMCGIDATQSFMSQHAGQARPEQELASFKIGVLVN